LKLHQTKEENCILYCVLIDQRQKHIMQDQCY